MFNLEDYQANDHARNKYRYYRLTSLPGSMGNDP